MAEVFGGINVRTAKKSHSSGVVPASPQRVKPCCVFAARRSRRERSTIKRRYDLRRNRSPSDMLTNSGVPGSGSAPSAADPRGARRRRGVRAQLVHRDLEPENIFVCHSTDRQPSEARTIAVARPICQRLTSRKCDGHMLCPKWVRQLTKHRRSNSRTVGNAQLLNEGRGSSPISRLPSGCPVRMDPASGPRMVLCQRRALAAVHRP